MIILKFMNGFGHRFLAEWAFEHLEIYDGATILDIGCGGGGNIARLLKRFPNSIVDGMDYSKTSVSLSGKVNSIEITNNRCHIILGSVNKIPLCPATYDVVTAFETIYYWQDIEKSFREVYRILKDYGTFYIVNGADAEKGNLWDKYIDNMHTYSYKEIENTLNKIGFKEIHIYREEKYPFLCISSKKVLS